MKTVREMFVSLTAMLINHIWASIIEIWFQKWHTQSLKKIEIQMSRHEKRYRSEEIAPVVDFWYFSCAKPVILLFHFKCKSFLCAICKRKCDYKFLAQLKFSFNILLLDTCCCSYLMVMAHFFVLQTYDYECLQ